MKNLFGNLKPETSNFKPETSNFKPQTSNLKPQTSNLKPQTIQTNQTNQTIQTTPTLVPILSANDMYEAARSVFPNVDAAIMTAAVADYKPLNYSDKKIKRKGENLTIELTANPDIAAKMGELKQPHQILVGFALETDNAEENATKKLKAKNLDFIVLNSPSSKDRGFMADTNKITIIDKYNNKQEFPLKTKKEIASDIIDELEKFFENINL